TKGTNYVTGTKGTRIDFISYHQYKLVTVGSRSQLNEMIIIRDLIENNYPSLINKPIQLNEIGSGYDESEPRNANRYEASFAVKMADLIFHLWDTESWGHLIEITSFWGWFKHAGWVGLGLHNSQYYSDMGVWKRPVLNAYEMLGKFKIGDKRLSVTGANFNDQVHAIAMKSADNTKVKVIVYNYDERKYDDSNTESQMETVNLIINDVAADAVTYQHYRIDHEHSNSYAVWEDLGKPGFDALWHNTNGVADTLYANDGLEMIESGNINILGNAISKTISLPGNSVSMLIFDLTGAPVPSPTTCQDLNGYVCSQNQICPGNWLKIDCCSQNCVDSTNTCSSLSGSTCESSQYCDANYLPASDNDKCCPNGSCMAITADFNCDNKIDIQDFGILLSHWHKLHDVTANYKHNNCTNIKSIDLVIDKNNRVDSLDLSRLLSCWGIPSQTESPGCWEELLSY
ncbi:hypothetical protein KKC16_00625, partial [Patescibacteria group bacterium]|nr:hypothetical protein [Patescibacteria group bacterium]